MSLYPEITAPVPTLYERCAALIVERDYLRNVAKTLAARVHQINETAKTHLEDMSLKLHESSKRCVQAEQQRDRAERLNVSLQKQRDGECADLQQRLASEIAEKGHLYTRLMDVIPRFRSEKEGDMMKIAELEDELAAKSLLLETMCQDLHAADVLLPGTVSEASQTESRGSDFKDVGEDANLFMVDIDTVVLEMPFAQVVSQESSEEISDAEMVHEDYTPNGKLLETSNVDVFHQDSHDSNLQDSSVDNDLNETPYYQEQSVPDTSLFMFDANTVVLETSDAEVLHFKSPVDQLRIALAGKTTKELSALTVAELTAYLGWIGQSYVKPKAKSIAILRNAIL